MALVSGRFKLDPRAPATERPTRAAQAPMRAPAAPARPKASDPLPAAPVSVRPAAAAATPPPPRRRRALLLAAVVVGILLVGGGVAAYLVNAESYPDKYVLKPQQYPQGLSTAPLSSGDRERAGVTSNPGAIDPDSLSSFETSDGTPPEQGYLLALSDAGGARIAMIALEYGNEVDALDFAKQARAICSFANGAALRDGKVLVLVIPENGASKAQVVTVARALLDKNGDLDPVCGVTRPS